MIYFNLGCPFVSEWTCAPPMIGFIVFSSTLNFDVKGGVENDLRVCSLRLLYIGLKLFLMT